MDTLLQDLRYARRALARQPSVALLVVFTLAIGIGANAAIFSIVNAVLLRPLPYARPDRLVMLYQKNERTASERLPQSYANYLDFNERSQSLASLAAYYGISVNLTGAGEPERIIGTVATASLFDVLGVKPDLGSAFTAEAEEIGKDQVVIISYRLWQRRFGGDPNVIGQTINLSDVRRQVVAVMPADFKFPHKDADLWVPLAIDAKRRNARVGSSWYLIGRLKDHVTIEQARSEAGVVAANLRALYPDVLSGYGVNLVPLHADVVGDIKPALQILMGTVALILLIACVNIANILLARAAAREKEIAIRLAVGAGRGRIIRQLLTESMLLAALGGGAGLLIARIGLSLLIAFSPADLPRRDQINMDWRVLAFTLGVALLTGIIFGIAPALQSSKPDLNEALKEGGRSSTGSLAGRRLRSWLMIAEVALSAILLIGAGLMMKSFVRLQQVALGFNPDHLVSMNIQLPRRMWMNPVQSQMFFKQLIEQIETLPGVESAGAISAIFIGPQPGGSKFTIEGRPALSEAEQPEAPIDMVSNGYFRAMQIRLLEGREFTDADNADSLGVVIINKTFARRFWPGESPLGARIQFGTAESNANWRAWRTVVGVVDDMRRTGVDADVACEAFWPHAQSSMGFMSVVTRTQGEPLALVPALHQAVWSLNKEQPISHTQTLNSLLDEMTGARRLNTLLFGLFAGIAVILTAAGIYGVMSYWVAQRTRDIGVRVALGAQTSDILRQFIGEGLRFTVIGLALGIFGAYFGTRLMASLLYEVSQTDATIFVIVPLLLASVAVMASFVPARRAARIDPLIALRHE